VTQQVLSFDRQPLPRPALVPNVPIHAPTWAELGYLEPDFEMQAFGTPAPQGSKNARAIYTGKKGAPKVFTGKVALHESSKKVKPWRAAVADAARAVTMSRGLGEPRFELLDGPLIVDFVFTIEKGTTLAKWKAWHDTSPDLSKLARSTEDALNKVVWVDDARICAYRRLEAVYVGADTLDTLRQPGVVIRVWKLPEHLIEDRKDRARRRLL
jgi:Holliday junction resolvase RusA-like endonuclease